MNEIFLYFGTVFDRMSGNPLVVALLGLATLSGFVSCLKSLLGDNHTISSDKNTISSDKNTVSLDKDTVSFNEKHNNEKHNTGTRIYWNGEPYYLDD